jgi:hypothetical protein
VSDFLPRIEKPPCSSENPPGSLQTSVRSAGNYLGLDAEPSYGIHRFEGGPRMYRD